MILYLYYICIICILHLHYIYIICILHLLYIICVLYLYVCVCATKDVAGILLGHECCKQKQTKTKWQSAQNPLTHRPIFLCSPCVILAPPLIWLRFWWRPTLWLANAPHPKRCWCPDLWQVEKKSSKNRQMMSDGTPNGCSKECPRVTSKHIKIVGSKISRLRIFPVSVCQVATNLTNNFSIHQLPPSTPSIAAPLCPHHQDVLGLRRRLKINTWPHDPRHVQSLCNAEKLAKTCKNTGQKRKGRKWKKYLNEETIKKQK